MSPTLPTEKTIVLGAGLMGRLLACELARQGHSVSLFDASGPAAQGAAARVAAAMLAPLAESAVTEKSVVQMGQYALTRWPALLDALEESVFFQQLGTLIVWHRQDAAEASRFARQLESTQRQIPSLPRAQSVDAQQISVLEPALGTRFAQGYFLPEEGQLDNRQLLDALLCEFERLPIDVHWHSPRELSDFHDHTGWVFDCRGLGGRTDWPHLRGVRGEVIRVYAPEVTLSRPVRLIHPRYPLYIAPKPGHIFVIGATEIESEDMSPVSVRSAMELLSAAYAVHSGFAEARIIELSAHCRPALPDNLPAIRMLGKRRIQVNGLYRHGFLIAPAMLDTVMELVNHGTSPLARTLGLVVENAVSAT
jgi:glycine oxidase